jgi:hypothetical protein
LTIQSPSGVEDLSGLRATPGLRHLFIPGARAVSDLSPLESSRNLTTLVVDNTSITTLDALYGMADLKRLECSWCRELEDISGVAASPIERLDLRGCVSIESYEPVRNISTLEQGWFGERGGLHSVEFLRHADRLERLSLQQAVDLADLEGLESPALRLLRADGCTSLRSLGDLANPGALRQATFAGDSSLSDCSTLAAAAQLQWLDLTSCTEISDFACSADWKN